MNQKLRLRTTVAAAALAGLFAGSALAQTPAPAPAAPAPEPDWTFTGNVGLYSQYVFRGISQTNEKPAIQGGFDVAHKSGFYVGTWASNISWLSDGNPDVSASMEWDFYGGYKWALPADFVLDLGVLYYWYPGTYPSGYIKPNTTEIWGLTVGIFGTGTDAESAAYTNRFGKDTSNSQFVGYIQKTF